MAQRFSTVGQYHKLVLAHGVIAAITFIFLVPISVMIARFSRGPPKSLRHHAYIQVLAIGLTTICFVIGYFAVGPDRSLTNPHHGIGVAIYVLVLVQAIGGRLIYSITARHSLRKALHRWFGRVITLLGIIQVPLGLTLYGSPKYLFILYTVWMAFLMLVYFILSYKQEARENHYIRGIQSEHYGSDSLSSSSGGNKKKWLGALAGGALLWKFFKKDRDRSLSPSRSSGVSRSHSRGPTVLSSRRTSYPGGSDSYFTEDKYSYAGHSEPRERGGFMSKIAKIGAAVGGAALLGKMVGRRKDNKADSYRDEYSTVESDTPTKRRDHHRPDISEITDETESELPAGRRTPLLPPPVQSGMTPKRPTTPRPPLANRHRPGQSSITGVDESDYSSYISASPSKYDKPKRQSTAASAGKGFLAGIGFGWLANKLKSRNDEKGIRYEEERRHGSYEPRYTGDGHPSPTRRPSRRYADRPLPVGRASSLTYDYDSSELSSAVEPRPPGSSHAGPPMPPLTASSVPAGASTQGASTIPPTITPVPVIPPTGMNHHSRSRSRSRHDGGHVDMPPMPDDPHGILHPDSVVSDDHSADDHLQRRSSRKRRGDAAAAEAVASASRLAAEEEEDRRRTASLAGPPSAPVSVSVKMHPDRDRITLRQLTEEERDKKSKREARRRNRADSVSSLSGPTDSNVGGNTARGRRYRRDSRERHSVVSSDSELAPPVLPFARRRGKDSAYYSGGAQAGPSTKPAPAPGATVSSLGSPDPYWSPGASNAASKREQRRASRRNRPPPVDFS